MVALSLSVLSTFSVSPTLPAPTGGAPSQSLVSTVPENQLLAMLSDDSVPKAFSDTTLPEKKIVAMLATPTLSPTDTPPSTPTATPTPTETPLPTPTDTPTPTPTETPSPTPTETPTPAVITASASDIDGYFQKYSDEYHVDKDLLRRIAVCESGYNSQAQNGDYGGMFQFATQSWETIRGRMGQDPNPDLRFSAEEAVKTAAYHIANGGEASWPNCK